MKNVVKQMESAMTSGDKDLAAQRLNEAISVIGKTASKGVIHKNKASRMISRLTKKVNALSA
jgi:small subunit ribosomal protein S20